MLLRRTVWEWFINATDPLPSLKQSGLFARRERAHIKKQRGQFLPVQGGLFAVNMAGIDRVSLLGLETVFRGRKYTRRIVNFFGKDARRF